MAQDETTQIDVLDRPVYGVSEAAELLGLAGNRVKAWLDGSTRKGIFYEPVIRDHHTGSDLVTWGEFVELGYLREYRRAGVSLQYLRPVIQKLRQEYGTPYPLAHHQPFVDGRELILKAQEDADLPSQLAIVVRTGQQMMLTEPVERFLRKVEFTGANESARVIHPVGPTSPVVIDPLMRFGRPSVRGVSTERLWELNTAGEPINHLAAVYELDEHIIRAAVSYEEQQRSLAA